MVNLNVYSFIKFKGIGVAFNLKSWQLKKKKKLEIVILISVIEVFLTNHNYITL